MEGFPSVTLGGAVAALQWVRSSWLDGRWRRFTGSSCSGILRVCAAIIHHRMDFILTNPATISFFICLINFDVGGVVFKTLADELQETRCKYVLKIEQKAMKWSKMS